MRFDSDEFGVRHLFRVSKSRRHHSPHQCAACRSRRALFRYRGEVRADRDHTLCFECFRSQLNRMRAVRLARAAA